MKLGITDLTVPRNVAAVLEALKTVFTPMEVAAMDAWKLSLVQVVNTKQACLVLFYYSYSACHFKNKCVCVGGLHS